MLPTELVEKAGSEQELESIENIYWADMAQALERLEKNDDFKKVILNGYFKDKAVNGVSLLATNYVKKGGHRPDIMEALVAISQLQDYFKTIKSMGFAPVEDESEE
jgi:hypothetical protein